MYIELGQLLSVCHRVLDGVEKVVITESDSGKKRKKTIFEHPTLDNILYKTTHVNHPSAVWIRESLENYNWAFTHFDALCKEFTHRYGKVTKTEKELLEILRTPPKNIKSKGLLPFALAFKNNPKAIVFNNKIQSYRNFYLTKQTRMKTIWTNREIPSWWTTEFDKF